MLSVLFAESADNLAHLIRFYAAEADRLLDVTYGAGTLSKKSPIPVVGVDRDPESKAEFIADSMTDLGLIFEGQTFPAAVFDPPYLYGAKAMHMGPVGDKTWSDVRSTWKDPTELMETSRAIAGELAKVLTADGIVFVKIMDSRFKGKLVRNHDLVIAAFEVNKAFRLIDQIVYIRTNISSYPHGSSAQSAHGYFLVFKREPLGHR